ncbi:MAG TPA: DUF4388 domain-containing protein [bacterium]|nr:DUF4388 domain-containing protein [bacterium]
MVLKGKLEDMPVVDVLQFIYASRRSGTLHLESRDRRGFVVFRDGNIAQASTNAAENNLGHILLARGLVEEGELARAVEAQRSDYSDMPLGRVLVETGLLSEEEVKAAVEEQIEGAVRDFVLWLDGDFVFELGTAAAPADDVAVPVEGILPGVTVDTQHLLLECIRIFDERSKPSAEPSAEGAAAEPAVEVTPPEDVEEPAPPTHTVYVYSDNEPLCALLASVAAKKKVDCRALQSFAELMLAVESTMRADRLPVVVLDADFCAGDRPQERGTRAAELVVKLKRAARALEVVCLSSRAEHPLRIALLERHARALVGVPPKPLLREMPPGPEVKNFIRELWTVVVEALRNYENVYVKKKWRERISSLEAYLLKLKRFVREAQKSSFTFMVSLDLLNLISENYERALLFVVREGVAGGIGGFGDAADGTPLGIMAKNVEVSLDEPSVFRTVAERKTTYRGRPDQGQTVHRRFFEQIGEPKNGEAVVVPLLSGGQTLAMIYCDNGEAAEPLVYDELLDLLSNQTSILYERMLAETLPRAARD